MVTNKFPVSALVQSTENSATLRTNGLGTLFINYEGVKFT